jgi:hypothetical protein
MREHQPISARRGWGLRRLCTLATAAIAGLAMSLVVTGPSQAHDVGSTACTGTPTTCVHWANNKWHAIRYDGVVGNQIEGLDTAVISTLNGVYDPTDLVAYRDESDPLPDVWIHDFNYGTNNNIVAWVVCSGDNTGTGGAHPDRWCRGQHARFNSHYIWYYDTSFERNRLACHELGHTLGLRHRQTPIVQEPEFTTWGCMHEDVAWRSGVTAGIDGHHRDHINSHY